MNVLFTMYAFYNWNRVIYSLYRADKVYLNQLEYTCRNKKGIQFAPHTIPSLCHTQPQSITQAQYAQRNKSTNLVRILFIAGHIDPALSQYMANGPRLVTLVACLTSVSTEPRDSLALQTLKM